MGLEAIATTYVFTCDDGKILDRSEAKQVLCGLHQAYSDCRTKVTFTIYDDNDTSKVQKIKGALWYSQKER